MASLPALEIAYQEAHIEDNLSTLIIAVCTVFTAVALLSLLARLTARRFARMSLSWDDYFAIAAMIALAGLNITACLTGHFGLGRHSILVAQDPQNFVRIGKTELGFSVFYDWSMALGKLSILALLARIFTLHQPWFKIGIYFWAIWTILWWISGWFVIFLECRPLSTSWGVPTQCRPAFHTSVAISVVNILSDAGILILPQPMVWRLHLPVLKKVALSFVFLVGTFATAISIARIPLLKGANAGTNFDPTYSSALPIIFTVIEPASVLICACLPVTQLLMTRLSKKVNSYYSKFKRSSPDSQPFSKHHSHSTPESESSPGRWVRLGASSFSSQTRSENQFGDTGLNGNEEYELERPNNVPRQKSASSDARSLV